MKIKVGAHYWRDWMGGWEFLESEEADGLGEPIIELDEDLIARYQEAELEFSNICDEVKAAVAKEKNK